MKTTKEIFTLDRLNEIRAQETKIKEAGQPEIDISRTVALRVMQWVQLDFEKNPSGENWQRLESAMFTYQHWMKNVKVS